jgi:hypothetical protein
MAFSRTVRVSKILALSLVINVLSFDVLAAPNVTNKFQDFNQAKTKVIAKNSFLGNKNRLAMPNYPIEHQGINTLDINVSYQFSQNNSALFLETELYKVRIYRQIDELLKKYSNEQDYWEVVNRYLTKEIIQTNPELASVTITLGVHPNQEYPYHRSSTVTQTREGNRKESWHFHFPTNAIKNSQNNFMQVNVNYSYKTNALKINYPDFIPICQQIQNLIVTRIQQKESWAKIDRELKTTLLQQHPMFSSLSIELKELK